MKNQFIKKTTFLILFGTMFSNVIEVFSQQDSQYTSYMYNTITINPAYAGSRGSFSGFGLYRTQWVGLEGAPETLNFSVHSPVGSKRVGLGFTIISDKIGPSEESNFVADFSYTLPISENASLSFGLKGGINLLNVDFTLLDNYDPTDPAFANNIENRLTPSAGVGIYLRSNEKWYLGISTPNFLSTKHYQNETYSVAAERPTFYAIGGYVFDLSDNVKFKPALLSKIIKGAPLSTDLSANFLFYKRFTLGAAYRLDAALSGLAGFEITNGLSVGYAYDYDTTSIGSFNSGSHEFFLRFELVPSNNGGKRMLTPRFF